MTPVTLQKVSSTTWDWAEMRSFCFSQALRVVNCPDRADEAAQEAIVRAWRHRESCCRRPNEVLVDEPLAGPNGQTDEGDTVESRLLFSGILGTLSKPDQELVWLRYYEDLTCAKLADHFGLSEATVKVRLHRLRRRLRQKLEEEDS
jgi:DNA-directed RNA polymerase specialized sigma24 family protein